ncbi:MAG: hypothetical protein ACLT98_04830 [Eggerthellaceae bacterium]
MEATSGTPCCHSHHQSNVYLAGLVERDWEEDTVIYNSYFKRNDIVGKHSAIEPYPDGYVRAWGDWLGLNYSGGENGPSAQGFGYGPIVDDAKYADRLFWEGEGYDFEGDEQRYSTIDNQIPAHVNKWVMDDYLGIPVHGDSVKATLDFPGAGDVTISQSTMGREQATADPYNFAVQAVSANETNLTFTATVDNDLTANDALKMVSSDANEGFRFQGWFRNKDVAANHIQQGNHAFFDSMVPPELTAIRRSTMPAITESCIQQSIQARVPMRRGVLEQRPLRRLLSGSSAVSRGRSRARLDGCDEC